VLRGCVVGQRRGLCSRGFVQQGVLQGGAGGVLCWKAGICVDLGSSV
jgi:hypothetical protein